MNWQHHLEWAERALRNAAPGPISLTFNELEPLVEAVRECARRRPSQGLSADDGRKLTLPLEGGTIRVMADPEDGSRSVLSVKLAGRVDWWFAVLSAEERCALSSALWPARQRRSTEELVQWLYDRLAGARPGEVKLSPRGASLLVEAAYLLLAWHCDRAVLEARLWGQTNTVRLFDQLRRLTNLGAAVPRRRQGLAMKDWDLT